MKSIKFIKQTALNKATAIEKIYNKLLDIKSASSSARDTAFPGSAEHPEAIPNIPAAGGSYSSGFSSGFSSDPGSGAPLPSKLKQQT